MKPEDKLRVYYIGKREGIDHEQVMTVAAEVQDDNTLRVGIVFCSPKDIFVRSIGKTKAIGRMRSKSAETIPFSGRTVDDIIAFINDNDEFHEGIHIDYNGFPTYVEKPNAWRHRTLVYNKTSGLDYVYNK